MVSDTLTVNCRLPLYPYTEYRPELRYFESKTLNKFQAQIGGNNIQISRLKALKEICNKKLGKY